MSEHVLQQPWLLYSVQGAQASGPPHQLAPQSRAQMGELRTAWARAARVDADASMSRGTAIRTARRAAEATAAEEEATAAEEEAAEEEEEAAAEEEEELLLGYI
jgi:hypothetical protein